jgi:hypothetical protein
MAYDDRRVISTGVSNGFNDILSTRTGDTTGTIEKDFSSLLPSSESLGSPQPFSLVKNKQIVPKGLDMSLLNRAKSIIDGFNPSDVIESAVNLESLRGIVLQLWESATNASQFHQEILANLESAILSVECPTKSQLAAFKEAVTDLRSDVLTQAHVNVIRKRFIREGFSPLAILSQIENADDSN